MNIFKGVSIIAVVLAVFLVGCDQPNNPMNINDGGMDAIVDDAGTMDGNVDGGVSCLELIVNQGTTYTLRKNDQNYIVFKNNSNSEITLNTIEVVDPNQYPGGLLNDRSGEPSVVTYSTNVTHTFTSPIVVPVNAEVLIVDQAQASETSFRFILNVTRININCQ